MSDKEVSKMAEWFYKYACVGKILRGFLSLPGKDITKAKKVKFLTEAGTSREIHYMYLLEVSHLKC